MTGLLKLDRIRVSFSREDGYALASILMVVTILSLVSFSVLALEYLERMSALLDISRIKAEYSARNGILCMAAELEAGFMSDSLRHYSFSDSGHASVLAVPWGTLYLVESTGFSGTSRATRRATLGARPDSAFSFALSLGSSSQQLVLTGSASVIGDVSVSPAGVSTGQIHGYSTPAVVPIRGTITHMLSESFPQVSPERIRFIGNYYHGLLERVTDMVSRAASGGTILASLPDSIGSVTIPAGSILADSIEREEKPLFVICHGSVSVGASSKLKGLISLISTDSILVESGSSLTGCVLVAVKGIRIFGAQVRGIQLISPQIILEVGSQATYPSIALSIPLGPEAGAEQSLIISSGVNFQGFAGMFSPKGDNLLDLESGSRLMGAVFSNSRLTLDGDLIGSAATSNLYFYEAPTSYFGWKRSGLIDRPGLPGGFLTPPIFAGRHELSVLEWL